MGKISEFDQKTASPFSQKIIETQEFIQVVLKQYKNPVVACSFGKDSIIVLYLVRMFMPEVTVVFNNTGVEYPETVRFARWLAKEWDLNYYEIKPEMTFWEIISRYGYPKIRFRNQKPKCCYLLKDRPAQQFYRAHSVDVVFTGLTYDESYQRRWSFIRYGWLHKSKDNIMRAHPIAYWSEKEVWDFIKREGLPINPAYTKYNIKRVGCMTCTAYIGWQEQMARNFPKLYDKIMRENKEPYLPQYIK